MVETASSSDDDSDDSNAKMLSLADKRAALRLRQQLDEDTDDSDEDCYYF